MGVRAWWAGSAAAIAGLAVVGAASAATLALVEAAGVEPAFDWGRVAVLCLWSALGAALYAGGSWAGSRVLAVAGAVWLAVTALDAVAFDLVELGRTQAGWAAAAVAAGLLAGGYGAELAPVRRRPLESLYAIVAFLASSGFAAVRRRQAHRGGRLPRRRVARARGGLAVLAAGLFRRAGSRDAATSLWAIAEVAAVAAALLLVEGTPLVAAAAALAVALAALNRVTGERRFAPAALVPLALAAGVTFVELAPPKDFFVANASPGNGALAAALVAAALAALALLVRVPPGPPADELDRVLDETWSRRHARWCRGSPPRPASTQARSRSSA